MTDTSVLIVEGPDDANSLRNLAHKNGLSICWVKDGFSGSIVIHECGGHSNLSVEAKRHLKLSTEVRTLGIVTDADESAESAFQSACRALFQFDENQSAEDVLNERGNEGWIGETVNSADDSVRAGVWVMPDNDHPGALEDFAAELIPEGDELWTYAGSVIDDLPERRFKPSHEGKARMHTYLAWQNPPREPIGRSITSDDGPLQHDSKLAHQFVAWLRTLYPNG